MLQLSNYKNLPQVGVTSLHRSFGSAASMRGNTFMKNKFNIEELNEHRPKDSRLTAASFVQVVYRGFNSTKVLCKCVCGAEVIIFPHELLSGNNVSCGCRRREALCRKKYTHTINELRSCHYDMISRCYNLKCVNYPLYGAKGVRVCDAWLNDYQKFLDWALANGWSKGLQLDKDIIPAKLKIPPILYSPDMCCFVTPKENAGTRSSTRLFNYKGKSLRISEICELEGLKKNTFEYFINRKKKSVYQAVKLTKKTQQKNEIRSHNNLL